MSNVKTVLFVCTGNTCRSVMAEGLMKEMVKVRDDIRVLSAGILAIPGFGPSKNTIEACNKHGIDISKHITRNLTEEMIKESDVVLVMEKIHKDYILDKWGYCKDKVFLLSEYGKAADTGIDSDIRDPIGQPIEVYDACLNNIKESLERLIKSL